MDGGSHLNKKQLLKPSSIKRKAMRQSGCLRRFYKQLRKEEKQKVKEKGEDNTQLNTEFQRTAKRDEKAFLSEPCKEIEENNRMGKTRELLKKIRYQGNISYKDGLNKGQKWLALPWWLRQ